VNEEALVHWGLLRQKKKEDKGVPVQAVKACRESRDIAPLILNSGGRWR